MLGSGPGCGKWGVSATGVWVSVGASLGVGGLQCLWAGNVGGVSVMSIWGVGDGGGTVRGAMLVQSAGMFWEYVCLGVFRGVAGSGMGAGLSWGQS